MRWNVPRSGMVLETLAALRRLRQAAWRAESKALFALRGRKRLSPLSPDQCRQFRRDGYLVAAGLIPQDAVTAAEAAMWRCLGADPRAPETWGRLGPGPYVLRDGRLLATYTDAMIAAAAQLVEDDVAGFRRPRHAFTVNCVPASRTWRAHEPHLDRTVPHLRTRTFPRPYRIGAMTYLTTVPPHGGGTIVWPGSHLQLEALARSDRVKYRYLTALSDDLGLIELGPPLELTPSRGDVLFHHPLCVHASSGNVSGVPRLAINHKW